MGIFSTREEPQTFPSNLLLGLVAEQLKALQGDSTNQVAVSVICTSTVGQ